jgi:hypothetical protein
MRQNFSVRLRSRLQVERLEDRSLLSQGGFRYQLLTSLGSPAPGGGMFINDFEPGGLNNRGDALFGADLGPEGDPSTFEGEGVFLQNGGQQTQLACAFTNAPGGGAFDFGFLGPAVLNDSGDAAFNFTLQPFSLPFGVNSGAYRYTHGTGTSAVVVPGVTPVPGGGTFAGVSFQPALNNRGDIVFPGIYATDQGIHLPDEPYVGIGEGLFRAANHGTLSRVVVPGDPAPGGGTFDFAAAPWLNNGGDVAFIAHVAGEEVRASNSPPQAFDITALTGVYVKKAATGAIVPIAHQGQAAPGGGIFRQAFSPVMNNQGDVVFLGDLTPPPSSIEVIGVYLSAGGKTVAVARPGDPVPGGGHIVTASTVSGNQTYINNRGDISFNAVLDTDVDGDGSLDTGLFIWSQGTLHLVARTGTVLPGVGTIENLVMGTIIIPPPPVLVPNSGAVSNDRGQVLFGATLEDGRGVLLVATPTGQGHAAAAAVGGLLLTTPTHASETLPVPGGAALGSQQARPMVAVQQSTAVGPSNGGVFTPLATRTTSAGRAIDALFAGLESRSLASPIADALV